MTIKWWESARYQEVVDHFRGKIQFVQVGERGHHHPKLEGVIDLRGQTTLRELVRLVHHAQGVLCSVTALMHLAAAVATKRGQTPHRPCVVVAGGREPAHWEAYPHHQFIHTMSALPCCAHGGCWKDRTVPLRDGNKRDRPQNLCVDVVGSLPHCMDMIQPRDVIRRVEAYFEGGLAKYLTPAQKKAGEHGVNATQRNTFDQHPLQLANAGRACDRFIATMPEYPGGFAGRGIVICGGRLAAISLLRLGLHQYPPLPSRLHVARAILQYLGSKGNGPPHDRAAATARRVECVDATRSTPEISGAHPQWLGVEGLRHSPFGPSAKSLPARRRQRSLGPPRIHFSPRPNTTPPARSSPGPNFTEREHKVKTRAIWRNFGLKVPPELEFESGQTVVDKERCWKALTLAGWINENSDFYYKYVHGDKETFHLAFRKLKTPLAFVPVPPFTRCLRSCGQHDFQVPSHFFQHRNLAKWDLFPQSPHSRLSPRTGVPRLRCGLASGLEWQP